MLYLVSRTWAHGLGVRGGKKEPQAEGARVVGPFDGVGEAGDERGDQLQQQGRTPKKRRQHSVISLAQPSMPASERSARLDALFSRAFRHARSQGRQRLTGEEQKELVEEYAVQTHEKNVSFRALRDRWYRMHERGTVERKPGSGRKRKMTSEMADMVKDILRGYNYDCSYQQAYEDFMTKMRELGRQEEAPKDSAFYNFVKESNLFKKRRKRHLPRLTEKHKEDRMAYAQAALDSDFAAEERTVFSDEKWFIATPPVTLRMPAEDKTPESRVQSKTNPIKVMMQVALMSPRGDFDGVVAAHAYTEVRAAQRDSVNRPKGTLIESNVNIGAANYVAAWRDTILPRLKELIKAGKIDVPTPDKPLLLQDDNAGPHRSEKGNPQLISAIAKEEFGIEMQPVDPLQPAQSPDLNPLDTFFFRVLFVRFRRLRAKARVQHFAAVGSRVDDEDEVSSEPEEMQQPVQDVEKDGADVVDVLSEEEAVVQRRIPLLCKCPAKGRGRCAGCSLYVNLREKAVKCAARGGYWHLDCARGAIVSGVQGAKGPNDEMDDNWVCHQCVHHLCTNRGEKKRTLCIKCNKPSRRTGGDDMGTDMVACDRKDGALYHKSCIGYNEADEEEDGELVWLCPLCEEYAEDVEYEEEAESLETAWASHVAPHVGVNSVEALHLAVKEAIKEIPREKIERGFETRRHIIKQVHELKGNNEKTSHWRKKRPREDGNGD